MRPETPNHALQRTAPRVTAASGLRLSLTTQPARRTPQSLSLGFGKKNIALPTHISSHPMKVITVFIVTCMFIGVFSASAERDEFPTIGGSYRLIYDSKPEGYFWPIEVKIIAAGEGQWYLVEYQIDLTLRRLSSIGKPSEENPAPETQPKIVTERRWLNFSLILAAEEKK